MSQERRHRLIRRVLAEQRIRSQDGLQAELASLGIEVAQPTLSRDLRRLGVVKGPDGYSMPEPGGGSVAVMAAPLERLRETAAMFVDSVRCAGQLVVIKTGPGRAQPVAVELDAEPTAGILGTIAGDDTVFVACASPASASALSDLLLEAAGLG